MFYLYNDLPECMFSLDMLEDIIWERFKIYTSPGNLQYDTEELYTCDVVAHVFMALIAVDYPVFRSMYMKGELKIFKERLVESKCAIKKQLPIVLRYLEALKQNKELRRSNEMQIVLNITEMLISKSRHIFKKGHSNKCRKLKLILPFTFMLKLVSRREVEVNNGKICLSCGQWDEVLLRLADFLLGVELKLIENDENLRKNIYDGEDDRIRQIIMRFVNFLNGNLKEGKENLKAQEIDKKSVYFPPCMANLHQILRQTHRLSYNSRYQYTLFLKDIGLTVDENIQFWENEYNKPHSGSSCTHEWEERHKRYKYQIQHLYGMIGTHGLKTSHGCEKFIQNLETKMDGGCPFQHYTIEELRKALPSNFQSVPDVEDIFMYKEQGMPQKACGVYLKCQQRIATAGQDPLSNRGYFIMTPLQYYTIAKAL